MSPLVRGQTNLVEPNVIGSPCAVQIQLEGIVDLFQCPTLLIRVSRIDLMHDSVDRERVVLYVVAVLLHVPGQVIPSVGLEIRGNAWNVGWRPTCIRSVVPDIP